MTATAATAPRTEVRAGSVAARLRGGLLAAWAAVTGAAPHDHDGQTYHFCAPGCHDTFTAHPDRYTATSASDHHEGAHA